ncbi:MAG: PEP-CTERM sorting domain-containing protein [Deltaproteobacteria bacterium]|nr:PEP-CTERM sorting domain-containing protein [Deltaproteobacteria bacterium]MBW2401399.1 PEP-CTERM sorting domain-containing protein [Deltaproteobacteria bacterium]
MEDTGGAIDGVDKLVFTNLVFDVDDWAAVQFGGSIAGVATTGTVRGTYEQFLGNASVGGPTNFGTVLLPITVGYGSLNCADSLTGQCGFTMGFDAPELNLNVGTTGGGAPYEFVWTFNVIVPEPSTASLLGLGLVGLASLRRRRA